MPGPNVTIVETHFVMFVIYREEPVTCQTLLHSKRVNTFNQIMYLNV